MRTGLMTAVSASKRQATGSHHPLRAGLVVILLALAGGRLLFATKPQAWIELHSPNFIVVTNANEKQTRHVAHQFEMVRAVLREYLGITGSARDQPVIIIAAKDEETLKTLLPEYWAKAGSTHPAGVYLRGLEKNYIGLRLDVSMNEAAYEPFEVVYHEYVHHLTRRLTSVMPLWLSEGLAEFYGNIRIEGKSAIVGAPSASRVTVLRKTPPLRLSTLFEVNASSPYYHEENKASIFYAESWALTHYLTVRDWRENTHRVNDLIALLRQNVPQAEAVRRTIGDPEALEGALNQYIRNFAFVDKRLDLPEIDESDFEAHPLSDAESLAVRADFMAHDRHYAEAQTMLEESLKFDPKLAEARESMGFLYLQQGKTAEAGEWYSEAVALNPKSYSANFYYAALLLRGKLDNDSAAHAESSLRAAVAINPDFAPAYDSLAYLLAMASPVQKPDEAYTMVLHAVDLEPGNVSYTLRAVQVLEHLGRAEDAVRVANLAVAMARTPQEQAQASTTLSSAQQFREYHNRAEEFAKAQASTGATTNSTDEKQQTPVVGAGKPSGNVAGSAIEQAARAAAASRGGYSGDGGNYGLGVGTKPTGAMGPLEILSDTMGVNFGPYLQRVVHDVRMNWYNYIPESAKAPMMRKGKVTIEFAILRNGTVAGMRIVSTSGDVALDRGAYGGITASSPFPPLPSEFGGQYVGVRFNFFYNPDKGDLAGAPLSPTTTSSKSGITVSISIPGGMKVPVGGSGVLVATVMGSTNTAVKWNITGSGCSGSACGTMSGDLYLAPKVLPSPASVELTATAEADSTASASVIVQLVQPDSR